jgi:enolase-phosphatase E1
VHGADVHPARGAFELIPPNIRAILLDIEGTTTPIAFVQQVLFPYARARVREFLQQSATNPGVLADIAALRAEHATEPATQPGLPAWNPSDERRSAEAYVYWLMDRDSKSTGLKSLQGRIWEAGYHSGELQGKGEVYPDVRPAFVRWRRNGLLIAIFSSGSTQAQRNLFANTSAGDLTPFLYDYFDTKTGPKRELSSYRVIAAALHQSPSDVLFVSDITAELDAARDAGMSTVLCVRGPDAPVTTNGGGHTRIHSFDELA